MNCAALLPADAELAKPDLATDLARFAASIDATRFS